MADVATQIPYFPGSDQIWSQNAQAVNHSQHHCLDCSLFSYGYDVVVWFLWVRVCSLAPYGDDVVVWFLRVRVCSSVSYGDDVVVWFLRVRVCSLVFLMMMW